MDVGKDTIRKTLDLAKDYLDQEAPAKLSEADTKAFFIEPIIAALGWEGLGIVTREYFVRTSQEFIDYMMVVEGQRLLAIEAKPLLSPLNEKHAAQLVQYCTVEGVEWAVLTNGCKLQLFNTFLKPDLDAKRVLNLDLLDYSNDDEIDALVQQLSQISRLNITTKAANLWLTQRRMDAILRDALFDPSSATIRAMRKALNEADINATGSEIVHWARTHLASKSASTMQPPTPAPPPEADLRPEEETDSDRFNPMESNIFQGSHQRLFPAFEALQSRIAALAPDTNWRVKKHYIAAAYQGTTFLSLKRRGSSLVIGVTWPDDADIPLPPYDSRVFKWSRINRAFTISTPEDVTDEVAQILQHAINHATSCEISQKRHFGVTLKQLMDANLISPGERMILRKGAATIAEAVLDQSGRINWQGRLYSSPSDRAFTEAMGRQSMNGWVHWFVERNANLSSLDMLRRQLLAA